MSKKIRIAIDGYSACGKSTFAKAIAQQLGYLYIDTGAMYRAVTLAMLKAGINNPNELDDIALSQFLSQITVAFTTPQAGEQPEVTLNGKPVGLAIREQQVAELVSPVAALPSVRKMLTAQQREIGKNGGIVMDGRDIGTAVFPKAEVKVFMTANPKIRAQRRYDEMIQKGLDANFDEILANLTERDYLDENRATSPLAKADDAILLDNSHHTLQQQLEWIMPIIQRKIEEQP